MLFLDFRRLMFMALVAGISKVCCCVACGTFDNSLSSVIQRKIMKPQCCWGPGAAGMAVLAVQSKKTYVDVWFHMAL